jgi:hypothetical protein
VNKNYSYAVHLRDPNHAQFAQQKTAADTLCGGGLIRGRTTLSDNAAEVTCRSCLKKIKFIPETKRVVVLRRLYEPCSRHGVRICQKMGCGLKYRTAWMGPNEKHEGLDARIY